MSIEVHILFLGPARDWSGVDRATLVLPRPSNVAGLRDALCCQYPKLAKVFPSIRMAVNQSFATDDETLKDGDEVALIPPVSGGCQEPIWVALFDEALPLNDAHEFAASDPSLGGIVTFEGATRGEVHPVHGALIRLDYEAYREMALKSMTTLAQTAMLRWPAGRIAILHRLGPVAPGETSVLIAAGCPHRAEAFDACRWLIDSLKQEVPIWKKDVYADGHAEWVRPGAPGP